MNYYNITLGVFHDFQVLNRSVSYIDYFLFSQNHYDKMNRFLSYYH